MSPLAFQFLAKYFNAAANPRIYGFMVLGEITVGYLGSNIFYWKAGKLYETLMKKKDEMADECDFDPETMDADVLVKL